jgi:acetylornithine deacetylase/succinyl-diaminopimelate desuccinylase-like protein
LTFTPHHHHLALKPFRITPAILPALTTVVDQLNVYPQSCIATNNCRAEADQRRYRAIQAALRREFAAPTTDAGGDTNPLTRRNKLSATNPLLDDEDDD